MILVRHGETQANVDRIYHGRFDSTLTERGIAQAQAIGRHIALLHDVKSFRLVTSPQPRALRTAEIIHQFLGGTTTISLDERLCEVSIGGWEGLRQEEIATLAPGTFDSDGRYEWCFSAPHGETYEGFSARIVDWLREAGDDPSLVVVTHGIVARVLRGLYAGLPRLTALSLPIPQDRIFRLSRGVVEEIIINDAPEAAPRLTKVMPLPNYCLFVQFDNGRAGTIDLPARWSGSMPALQDEGIFRQVTVDDFGAICWPVGPGLSSKLAYEWLTK